ncbi:hypothetical protein CLSA_c19100 [Clostridium saccharobutylicum DSM 13864]|uniref:Uncharacterized protein n=1 Tax=Clostridium saccharobutylicum DSM 13864 TaxID=1345695 RepID=U5MQQ2_CLOSA|nr:hypothetical protein CLSA_c19100 [Clostridium saccharobutylicum DSM 13864]OAV39604.1 hypothetical protein M945_2969 [Clostridium saccharobutylicum DSM 13864]
MGILEENKTKNKMKIKEAYMKKLQKINYCSYIYIEYLSLRIC